MIYPHRYLAGAQTDLFDGVRYYEAQQPGLGGEFLDEIELAITDICEHPKRWLLMMRRVRRRSTRRFPYGIFYAFAQDKVFIIAIGDLRRRPGWWKSRMKGFPF